MPDARVEVADMPTDLAELRAAVRRMVDAAVVQGPTEAPFVWVRAEEFYAVADLVPETTEADDQPYIAELRARLEQLENAAQALRDAKHRDAGVMGPETLAAFAELGAVLDGNATPTDQEADDAGS